VQGRAQRAAPHCRHCRTRKCCGTRALDPSRCGVEGQRKLKARACCWSARGSWLSRALIWPPRVGRLGVVDFDVVDKTNPAAPDHPWHQRGGEAEARRRRPSASGFEPERRVETFETRLTSENALDIIRDFDIVADGTDNFPDSLPW